MSCHLWHKAAIDLSLEHAILGFLSEHPRSGYDLKTRCFDAALSHFWTADQAQIYRTLERLREAKLVRSTRKRQAGRPDRRIYEITQAGHDTLNAWLRSPVPPPALRDGFLIQLRFASSLEDSALTELLSSRRELHQARLDSLRANAVTLSKQHGTSARDMALRQAALDGAMASDRAAIDWLDDYLEALREGALPGSDDSGIGQRHLFGTSTPA